MQQECQINNVTVPYKMYMGIGDVNENTTVQRAAATLKSEGIQRHNGILLLKRRQKRNARSAARQEGLGAIALFHDLKFPFVH